MRILSVTGVTSVDRKTINKPVSHIMMVKDGALAGEKFTVQKLNQKTNKSTDCCIAMAIESLSEIAAQNEGFYKNSTAESIGVCQLGDDGVNVDEQNYLVFDVTGMEAGKNYLFYGIEDDDVKGDIWKYKKLDIPVGVTEKVFTFGENDGVIALPVTGLTRVKFVSRDSGSMPEFLPDELRLLAFLDNDTVRLKSNTVGDDLIFQAGYENFFVLNVKEYRSIEIYTTGVAYQAIGVEMVKEA